MTIISGTTPTISFTFSEVNVSDIAVAILTVKVSGETLIEKDLSDAGIGDNIITWELTQEETLKLKPGTICKVCCDWKLNDGTRGRSNVGSYTVENSGINEVI